MSYVDERDNDVCKSCLNLEPRIGNVEPAATPHPHEEEVDFQKLYVGYEFSDDVKGGHLDRGRVIAARKLEMDYFKQMGVHRKVPRQEAKDAGVRVITTKWIDTNKGSEESQTTEAG